MPDWTAYVRRNLSLPGLRPEHEEEIVEDLAQQLEQAYEEALHGGADESQAQALACQHISDWSVLAKALAEQHKGELAPLHRWQQRVQNQDAERGNRFVWPHGLSLDFLYGLRVMLKNPVSDNVGGVKLVWSVLLRALEEERHFALVEGSAVPTQARLVIVVRSGTRSDPAVSSIRYCDHDY